MKHSNTFKKLIIGSIVLAGAAGAYAGAPFNGIEGYGGGALNPLAWTLGQNKAEGDDSIFGKPQVGAWYVNLGDVDVDWSSLGAGITVADRLELSYSYELIAKSGEDLSKNNIGAKLNLLPENTGGSAVPAISIGAVYKTISESAEGVDDSDADFYVVATKLITQLPRPVVLSAGLLSTAARTTGVFGFGDDRDVVGFGNVAVLPFSNIGIGAEYKQGADVGDGFKNADYWNAHLIWFASPNLSVIGAYVNAGDHKDASKVGLGDGAVVSLQYAF
ncbi:MAG: DUF3034 family protein [Verrucomicrobia bacterium]|nr:DUF3034 family protein [Kiritimatiellia bacterium]MCO6400880.1 DUF3034 family protein [Verrucomicrobiota bacterium]